MSDASTILTEMNDRSREVFRRVVLLPGGRESDPLDLFAGVVSETKSSLSKP